MADATADLAPFIRQVVDATEAARGSRVGAGDPRSALSQLMKVLLAQAEHRQQLGEQAVLERQLVHWQQVVAKGWAQWLELAKVLPELVDGSGHPVQGVMAQELRTRALGTLSACIKSNSTHLARMRAEAPDDAQLAWWYLEAKATLALAAVAAGYDLQQTLDVQASDVFDALLLDPAFDHLADDEQSWLLAASAAAGASGAAPSEALELNLRKARKGAAEDLDLEHDLSVNLLLHSTPSRVNFRADLAALKVNLAARSLGPAYSRMRIARLSRLHSSHLVGALRVAKVEVEPHRSAVLLEAVQFQRELLLGKDAVRRSNEGVLLTLVSATGGESPWAVAEVPGQRAVAAPLPIVLNKVLAEMFEAMQPHSRTSLSKASRPILSTAMGSLLQNLSVLSGFSVQAVGPVALLPVLAAKDDKGGPLSSRVATAYRSPMGTSRPKRTGPTRHLLLLDTSLEKAGLVRSAWRDAWSSAGTEGAVLEFASEGNNAQDLSEVDLNRELQTASDLIFFGHGDADDLDAGDSALLLGPTFRWFAAGIAANCSAHLDTALLVACSGARPNAFVGNTSVADAFAARGVPTVLGTFWPILTRDGRNFAIRCAEALQREQSLGAAVSGTWRKCLADDARTYAPFCLMT